MFRCALRAANRNHRERYRNGGLQHSLLPTIRMASHRTPLAPSCAAALRLKDGLPYHFKNLLTFVLGWLGKPLNDSERLPNSFGFG
jgi:hypothetical protein